MARPSVISLELPTQGFSFQDVESSIIMFPFRRRKERKRERGRETEREWRRDESQTLMVPEWGFVHLLHLDRPSSSALSLTTPQTIKDPKYRSPPHTPTCLSLYQSICALQLSIQVYHHWQMSIFHPLVKKLKSHLSCCCAFYSVTHEEEIVRAINKMKPPRKILPSSNTWPRVWGTLSDYS